MKGRPLQSPVISLKNVRKSYKGGFELGLPLVHDEMAGHAGSLGYITVAVGIVIGLYYGYISVRRRRWRRQSCS